MMQAFSSLKLLCSGFLAEAGAAVPAKTAPLITDDAVILGILLVVLAAIFKTASLKHPFWKKFYTFCPVLLLCYFIPSLLGSLGIVATDKDGSKLYFVTKNYLLPTSLVLLTLSIDLKGIIGLGPKALILFLTGTVGILFGGPLAILIVSAFSPEMVAGDGPEAVESVVPLEDRPEAHLLELVDGSRCETVTTGLIPGKRLAFDDQHVKTVGCSPVGGGSAGGSSTDD